MASGIDGSIGVFPRECGAKVETKGDMGAEGLGIGSLLAWGVGAALVGHCGSVIAPTYVSCCCACM